jgi:hypothetical protein
MPDIQLRCKSREYKEQSHSDGRGKKDLESMVISGDDVPKSAPNNNGRQHGHELRSSTPPIPTQTSGTASPHRFCWAGIHTLWA